LSHRALAISGTFLVLLLVTMGPKLVLGWQLGEADDHRLAASISERLSAGGFATRMAHFDQGEVVIARRDDCRLQVRNGDQARVLRSVFGEDAAGYGPLQYGYRSRWARSPASVRSVVERAVQNRLVILDVPIERPAVIALAEAGDCRGVTNQLDGLYVFAKLND
jgi:hypothetical protein